MLKKTVNDYLKRQDEFELLPEYKTLYKDILASYGFSENSSIVDLMSTYSGEFYGKEGFIINIAADLSDLESSVTKHLWDNENLPEKYFSLFNLELDDYLLYNRENHQVVLVEGSNTQKLVRAEFSRAWESFDDFLDWFFDL